MLNKKIIGIVSTIAGTSSAVGGGIYLSSRKPAAVIKKESISKLLESETSLLLLEEVENVGDPWGAAWNKFKVHYKDKKVPENWKDLESLKTQSDAPQEFKNLCKSDVNAEVESKNDEVYKLVRDYCTRQK